MRLLTTRQCVARLCRCRKCQPLAEPLILKDGTGCAVTVKQPLLLLHATVGCCYSQYCTNAGLQLLISGTRLQYVEAVVTGTCLLLEDVSTVDFDWSTGLSTLSYA